MSPALTATGKKKMSHEFTLFFDALEGVRTLSAILNH
jgi:hypothetical protein